MALDNQLEIINEYVTNLKNRAILLSCKKREEPPRLPPRASMLKLEK